MLYISGQIILVEDMSKGLCTFSICLRQIQYLNLLLKCILLMTQKIVNDIIMAPNEAKPKKSN